MSSLWSKIKTPSVREDAIKIQYMSDLHLEAFNLYEKFDIPREAPYLLLAGDVGRFSSYEKLLSFFHRQCESFNHVYYVLGNHEFYGLDQQRCIALAEKLEREDGLQGKLTVLNRSRVDINHKVTLLGCTLFSHIPDDAKRIVQEKVNDFKGYISDWTVDEHNQTYAKDKLWLQEQIEQISQEQSGRKIVVVTHYAPSMTGTAEEKYKSNPWNSAFATDLIKDDVSSWKGHDLITHWVFGHTHHCCELLQSNIKLLSNQHGYFPQDSAPIGSNTKKLKLLPKSKAGSPQDFDAKRCIELKY